MSGPDACKTHYKSSIPLRISCYPSKWGDKRFTNETENKCALSIEETALHPHSSGFRQSTQQQAVNFPGMVPGLRQLLRQKFIDNTEDNDKGSKKENWTQWWRSRMWTSLILLLAASSLLRHVFKANSLFVSLWQDGEERKLSAFYLFHIWGYCPYTHNFGLKP